MSRDPKHNDSSIDRPQLDCRKAKFPSDVLSIARLRILFPDRFDHPDTIADGFSINDFFLPYGVRSTGHLTQLNEMICDERVIAAAAFVRHHEGGLNGLSPEEQESLSESKKRLEQNYQQFKLADSPSAARLLIQEVEQEALDLAIRSTARGR